jgi:tetratricopeptide (TPR) repeat protein
MAYHIIRQDPDEALTIWQKVLCINPDHLGARIGMSRIYSSRGDSQSLQIQAEELREHARGKGGLREVGGYCIQLGLYQTAIDLYSRYLEYEPMDVEALADVASSYARMGYYRAAITGYRSALQIQPRNQIIIHNLKSIEKLLQEKA